MVRRWSAPAVLGGILCSLLVFIFTSSAQAVERTDPWYDTAADGSVTQTFYLRAPQVVGLEFRYCDGLSCGNPQDPELDCYVNKYNPQFADVLARSVTVAPLPGSQPKKLFLKAGSLPGFTGSYGYYDPNHANDWNSSILETPPTFNADGSVTLNFHLPQFMGAFQFAPSGRMCGLTEDQYHAFQNKYGSSNDDNFYKSSIKIAIVWSRPNRVGTSNQTITVNGQSSTSLASFGPASVPLAKTIALRQDDRRWRDDRTLFEKTQVRAGTVPTALASFLRQFSVSQTPPEIGSELMNRNVFRNGTADWNQVMSYLKDKQRLTVREVAVPEALAELRRGSALLTAWTDTSRAKQQESAIVVTAYDATKDRFTIIDPARGERTISWNDFMKGQPWLLSAHQ